MPYQKSTKAQGFKARSAVDTSKKFSGYAKALETSRKAEVRDFERQAVEMQNENIRTDRLSVQRDKYELQNLTQFSKTLNKFVDDLATDVITPIRLGQIDDGITLGIQYMQGVPSAIEEVELQREQIAEIDARVEEQSLKTSAAATGIEAEWDREKYKASLEDQYRLLNIKKLGRNKAFGFRKGMLKQSAVGYPAYRDAALIYNEENEISTRNIGTEDDPIIIGNYNSYKGESGREKRKAILGYLTQQYIFEKGQDSGLQQVYIDELLTRPILEENAKFQQTEASKALLEEAQAASEDNKESILRGFDEIETDGGKLLQQSIQHFLLTEPGNQRGMGKQGSTVANANDLLVSILNDQAATLDQDTLEDYLDLIGANGTLTNIDSDNIVSFEFNVPGVTKKNKPQTLASLWPAKFNVETIREKALAEITQREADERTILKQEAIAESGEFLAAFYENRDENEWRHKILQMKDNPKYFGILTPKFFSDLEAQKDALHFNEELSKLKVEELEELYGNNPIPPDNAVLSKLHPDVFNELMKSGKVAPDMFGGDSFKKAQHVQNTDELTAILLGHVQDQAPDINATLDHPQLVNAKGEIDNRLRELTRNYLHLEGENITFSQAMAKAKSRLEYEISIGAKGEGADEGNKFVIDPNGLQSFRPSYDPIKSPKEIVQRHKTVIEATKTKIDNSSIVDIFSDIDQPPVVNADDLTLINDKPSSLFTQLSKIDPLSRTPTQIWELQAQKIPGTTIPEWDEKTQLENEAWESLHPNIRKALVSGNNATANRGLEEIGVLNLDSTISILSDDGDFPITEEDLPMILAELNLQSMTLEEIEKNPQLLQSVYKQKILNTTREVQAVTTDENQAIRMIFAGMKFGDINLWNSGDVGTYTLAALNAYRSGDGTVLNGIPLRTEEGLDIYAEDFPETWDILELNQQIETLQSQKPTTHLPVESVKRNWLQDKFNPPKVINPTYKKWAQKLQLLTDKRKLSEINENGFVRATDVTSVVNIGKRILSEEEFTKLEKLVLERFPAVEGLSGSGDVIDYYERTGRIGESYTDAYTDLAELILAELGIQNTEN